MSRTNYILVDSENVSVSDWSRIIGRPVKVILVIGPQKRYVDLATAKIFVECSEQISFLEIKKPGKNAADFLIAERIGTLRAKDPQGYFHIISKDKGFDPLIENLKGERVLVARRSTLGEVPVLMDAAERLACAEDFLRRHPKNRPARRSALCSQLQVIFGKALSAEDEDALVTMLERKGTLTVDPKGKVTCHLKAERDGRQS
jgi:hypothetical protein